MKLERLSWILFLMSWFIVLAFFAIIPSEIARGEDEDPKDPPATSTPTVTPTITLTPTPTFALWQYNLPTIVPYGLPVNYYQWDLDRISVNEDIVVCWGWVLPRGLPPGQSFTIERKYENGAYVPITRTIMWRGYGHPEPSQTTGYYRFLDPGPGPAQTRTPLPPGRYYYRILQNNTPLVFDEGSEPPVWKGGIEVVTPCPTSTPKPTEPDNLVWNPWLAMRLINGIAAHWKPFTWDSGCLLPPTNSSMGLGIAPLYDRSYTDAPQNGGSWSQKVYRLNGPFAGGIYQQIRVNRGEPYEVRVRWKIAEGGSNTSVGLGVALDGSTDPSCAEFWQWQEKTTGDGTTTGNWGTRSNLGTGWVERDYIGGIAVPVADTMTIFLFAQADHAASVLFNDVLVQPLNLIPTQVQRDRSPLLVVRDGSHILMALGAWGDLVAESITGSAPFPQQISQQPLSACLQSQGAWVDAQGNFKMTGSLIECLPAQEDRIFTFRGATGAIVFAMTTQGDVYAGAGYESVGDDDGDGLSNLAEIAFYGTYPNSADSDGDGVSDQVELFGGGAAAPDLRIHEWGADPLHKDLWMELDWMSSEPTPGTPTPIATIGPREGMIEAVVDMFARARLPNPDGIEGITLHVDAGPTWSVNFAPPTPTGTPGISQDYGGGTLLPFKPVSTSPAQLLNEQSRSKIFKYGQIVYDLGGDVGGTASMRGMPFWIDTIDYLYGSPIPNDDIKMSRLLGHELGHTLGLYHYSAGEANSFRNVPNYNSLMSYNSLGGRHRDRSGRIIEELDFSYGDWLSLDENAVNESHGFCGVDYGGIDWNSSGCFEQDSYAYKLYTHEYNLNQVPVAKQWHDYNDWENLYFRGFGLGVNKPHIEGEIVICDFREFE